MRERMSEERLSAIERSEHDDTYDTLHHIINVLCIEIRALKAELREKDFAPDGERWTDRADRLLKNLGEAYRANSVLEAEVARLREAYAAENKCRQGAEKLQLHQLNCIDRLEAEVARLRVENEKLTAFLDWCADDLDYPKAKELRDVLRAGKNGGA